MIHEYWNKMAWLIVSSESILYDSQWEYTLNITTMKESDDRVNVFELTQRYCYQERAKDILRADDTALGISFTPTEESQLI